MNLSDQNGNAGYKFLLFCLPSLVTLIMLTTWLYPRWPKTKASLREKVTAVITNSVREAVQKELQGKIETETVQAAPTTPKVEEPIPPNDEDVNIIAKGTDKGLVFYTERPEGNHSHCGMRVDTSPSGAEVTLNGSIVGRTPIELRGQCNSSFNVKLYKKDFELIERTLTYAQSGSVAIRLHRKPASITPPTMEKSGLGSPLDLMDGDL